MTGNFISFGLVFEPIADEAFKTFSGLSEEFKSFAGTITEVSHSIIRLESDLKKLKTFKELQTQISNISEEEKKLSARKEELQKRYKALNEELNNLKKQYREGKISTEEYQKAESGLKAELNEVENEIRNLESALNSLQTEKRETENRAKSLSEELEKLGYTTKEVDKWIDQLEKELNELQKEGKETESTFGDLSEKLKSLAGVGIGGLTFGSIVKDIVDAEGVARRIVANTTLGWEKVAKLQRDILDLYKETGASEEEIEETIENIVQQYGTWNDEAKKAAETALKLSKITGGKYEPTELIHAAMQLKRSFKDVKTLDEAFQHIYVILQNAGDSAGDLLDVLREYSPLLGESGLKAKEFAGALIAGAKAGAFNFDKIADMLKEGFKAGLAEGSNLQDLMQKLNNLQQQYGDLISQSFSEKQWVALKSAFVDYINAVKSGDKELQKRSFIRITTLFAEAYKKNKLVAKELMQQVFGTIGTEDLAIKVVEAIAKGIEQQKEFYQNAKSIEESYQNMLSTWQKFEGAVRAVKTELAVALTPLVDKFASGLEILADFVKEHSTLTASIVGTAGALITLGGAVKLLGGAFGLVKSGLGALLSPLGLFKKGIAEGCSQASCLEGIAGKTQTLSSLLDSTKTKLGGFKEKLLSISKLKPFEGLRSSLSQFSVDLEKVKTKWLSFKGLLSKPLKLANAIPTPKGLIPSVSPIEGELLKKFGGGLLSKVGGFLGRIGLKGLARVGLNLLGPVGWAINAGLMAWDAWSLIKDTGIGKAITHGVGKAWDFAQNVGSSIWSGVKSILGIGEQETGEPLKEKIIQKEKSTTITKEKKETFKEVRSFENYHKEVENLKEIHKAEIIKPVATTSEIKSNLTTPTTEGKDSLLHKAVEIATPIGGAIALAHKVGSWFSHLFGGKEEKEPSKEVKQNITTPIVESDSLLRKVEEITKLTAPIGGFMTLAHKVGSWFPHLFGGEEEKEPPKEVKHFEKLHKEVVRETTNTQKVETVKEGTPIEIKPNITFNVNVNSTEPQRVKEEILKTLERLTPNLLDWLERALEELKHRNAPVY